MTNQLYYGDNLEILRECIPDESVDLIYLDPPFNSGKNYNVLFKEANGNAADAQIKVFEDTWTWGPTAEATFRELAEQAEPKVVEMIQALVGFMGRNDMTAYLVMMTVRLIELHRVLKLTGSLYLHCDPTASHYLKIVLDTIFGGEHFRNELIWRIGWLSGYKTQKKGWIRNHDTLLYYVKSNNFVFNKEYIPYPDDYVRRDGKRPTGKGFPIEDTWNCHLGDTLNSIMIMSFSKEKLGYPTQKPVKLLERIIKASSNEGDVVLDPFCGCGTAIAASQKLGRTWIGIDITYLATSLIESRLNDMYGDTVGYEVIGVPVDEQSAYALAQQDRFQFEWWALSLIKARPAGGKKKGADKGIDGIMFLADEPKKKAKKIVVQVKSGKVHSSYVRDLKGVVGREKAAMGFLITLEPPTKPMITEALSAGLYHSPGWNQDYQKIQILTVKQLLDGHTFDKPAIKDSWTRAKRVQQIVAKQVRLL